MAGSCEDYLCAELARIYERLTAIGLPHGCGEAKLTFHKRGEWQAVLWRRGGSILPTHTFGHGASPHEAVDAVLAIIADLWTPADALATIGLNPDGTIMEDASGDDERKGA